MCIIMCQKEDLHISMITLNLAYANDGLPIIDSSEMLFFTAISQPCLELNKILIPNLELTPRLSTTDMLAQM